MITYEPESEYLRANFPMFYGAVKEGVYVDLGASHPTNASLTHFCRDLGWRGVAVDGNSDYGADWVDAGLEDHFYCAVLSDEPLARFVIHDNSFTSRISPSEETDHPERWGIKRIVEKNTVHINTLLQNRGIEHIDLLCCDLEGMDLRVLRTLDWRKHTPSFVIVEHTAASEPLNYKLINFLLDGGYELLRKFPANAIFKRK